MPSSVLVFTTQPPTAVDLIASCVQPAWQSVMVEWTHGTTITTHLYDAIWSIVGHLSWKVGFLLLRCIGWNVQHGSEVIVVFVLHKSVHFLQDVCQKPFTHFRPQWPWSLTSWPKFWPWSLTSWPKTCCAITAHVGILPWNFERCMVFRLHKLMVGTGQTDGQTCGRGIVHNADS